MNSIPKTIWGISMEAYKDRRGPCHAGQGAHNVCEFAVSTSDCALFLETTISHLSSCQLKDTSSYLFCQCEKISWDIIITVKCIWKYFTNLY